MEEKFTNPLKHVRVAAPCLAEWKQMHGNDRVRFCDKCSMNVYNLSALTRREAERVVMSAEGRLCVRFYRRADGTILTRNCPVGLRALKQRLSRTANAVASTLLSFLAGVGIYVGLQPQPDDVAVQGYTLTTAQAEEEPGDYPVTTGEAMPPSEALLPATTEEVEETLSCSKEGTRTSPRMGVMARPVEVKGEAYIEDWQAQKKRHSKR